MRNLYVTFFAFANVEIPPPLRQPNYVGSLRVVGMTFPVLLGGLYLACLLAFYHEGYKEHKDAKKTFEIFVPFVVGI